MKIACIFPSRGLVFSRTAEELLNNLEGYEFDIFFSHGIPIPDCFEKPLRQALKDSTYTHIWVVEDDQIIPEGTLDSMILMDSPVVTMDYPVSREGQGTVFQVDGKVIFSGTGCLLIKREVFHFINKPYFRTDVKWTPTNFGKFIRFTAGKSTRLDAYGLHDVTFGLKLYKAQIPISVAGTIGQRKLKALGKAGTNDGAHDIEEWTKVKPDYLLKTYKKFPIQPSGKLITVQTDDGEMTVHPTFARKLIKQGKAKSLPKQSFVVDYGDISI